MEKLISDLSPLQRRQLMSFISYCMAPDNKDTQKENLNKAIVDISNNQKDPSDPDRTGKGIELPGGYPKFCECCKNQLSVLYKQEGAEHNMATIVDGLKTTAGLAGIIYLLVSSVMTYRSYKQNKMPKAR